MKTYTEQEMRQIIVERYSKPKHFFKNENQTYAEINLRLDTCSDQLNLLIKTDGHLIKELKFNGSGCAISTASADILCEMLVGQDFKKATLLLEAYDHLINHDQEIDTKILGELIVLKNIYKQRARKKCATLFSNGLWTIIKGEKNEK
ncbi:Fe-S cluster assembly sulfur transfer protein SufU [Williamsoniiplasma lucivorax]|uniref:FeS assembly protein n=1 Tax=Williamsoniiplasma lucivorax TaxID=209274 RepID=A0A2S5RDN7_9MOLU|nr:SUF system NifU family Fe-S cluster assembly protein [Williamsoniiplasma lucivorax]PPE05433.1 FeS assembly protein [Williamsoniiplasma lucivorax]